jgi:peptide-methionine (R)-S-oxide reductase
VFAKKIDFSTPTDTPGIYVCSQCSTPLFEAAKRFEAGCGYPSFWMHLGKQVTLNPLHTYGRERIQLLCSNCGQHLGHLFSHSQTPSQLRYCINADSIQYQEM